VRAQNFKKLKAVSIKPDRSLFKISGRNEQGKSSVLDIIAAAIGGKDAFPPVPVRLGEEQAEISVDFGALKITRTITNKQGGGVNHTLTLEFADGKRPKEKQHVLDELRGSPIADDPLAFSRMKPKDRFDLVKGLVDFDFADMAKKRKDLFEERTAVGRDLARAKAAVQNIDIAPDTPRTLLDVTALAQLQSEAMRHNTEVADRKRRREQSAARVEEIQDQIDMLTAEMNELNQKLAKAEKLPPMKDVAAIELKIANADKHNSEARKAIEKDAAIVNRDNLDEEYENLTQAISDQDDARDVAIKKAKLPVDNLSFGDDDIMVDGLPFDAASTARKMRVATALLMSLKPQLRVLLVREGSLLDDEARAALEADAEANNFVVLMETVGEDVSAGGVIIEDGMVVR
jgi:predicted ATP-dependent endonuclease of OLD family